MKDKHGESKRIIINLEWLLADDLDPVPLPTGCLGVELSLPEEHHLLLVVPDRAVDPVHDDVLLQQLLAPAQRPLGQPDLDLDGCGPKVSDVYSSYSLWLRQANLKKSVSQLSHDDLSKKAHLGLHHLYLSIGWRCPPALPCQKLSNCVLTVLVGEVSNIL